MVRVAVLLTWLSCPTFALAQAETPMERAAEADADADDEPPADTDAELDPAPGPDVVAEADGEETPLEENGEDGATERGEDIVGSLGSAIGNLGTALGPEAAPHNRIRWDPSWPRYRFDELVVTLGFGLVILLEEVLPTRTDANWASTSPLDREVQNVVGLDNPFDRDVFEELSDAITAGLFIWPVAFDSLLYAGLGEGAWDVAWQMSLISLEVFAINHALTVLVQLLARRERPLGEYCRDRPGYAAADPLCNDPPPAQSFWGTHVSNAFAGAALICMHHDALDLYGNEVADGMACGTALGAAVATGLFRMMADHHYITDVMSAAVVGSLTGILVPYILHYQGGARPPLEGSEPPTIVVLPMGGPDTVGLSATAIW